MQPWLRDEVGRHTVCSTGFRCASGCVVECRICSREVAGSNLGRGYFAPRSTQPSIPLGSVNEYQLRLGMQRQVWLIPLADEMQGVPVKLCYPLTTRAIPERLRDASCGGAIQFAYLYLSPLSSNRQFTLVTSGIGRGVQQKLSHSPA